MEQSACRGFYKSHLLYSLGSAARFVNSSSGEKPRQLRGTDRGWWYPDRLGNTLGEYLQYESALRH